MKNVKYLILVSIVLFLPLCGKKNKENRIPLEQLNIDKSTNYKYIFRGVIKEQQKREDLGKKDPFKN